MANTQESTDFMKYAKVDTSPGASGYFTPTLGPRNIKGSKGGKFWFDVSGSGTMTVVLQRKPPATGATWETYETFTSNDRKEMSIGAAGVQWRAGVLNDAAYTSGTKYFGFDW